MLARAFIIVMFTVATGLIANPSLAANKIGVASAVKNEVKGDAGRALAAGSQVFEREVVTTGVESMAQLLFLDETTLSIGPKSQVTLDKFVYSPSKNTGSVILSASKGAFRFISGSQDSTNYTIKTPVATIGVRGTIVNCFILLTGLVCIVEEGSATIGGRIVQAGQAIFIAFGGAITGPMTPDGRFFAVSGNVPWPLFGGILPAGYERFEGPDGLTIRTEQTDQHVVPEVDDGGECYPDCYFD